MENDSENTPVSNKSSLGFLFFNFLKIGALGFGGFMALISMIENVVVHKQKLITHNDMLEGISLANILPGPQAVNVVAFVGYRCRGGLGAFVSVVAVLLPTFLLIVVFTHLYFTYNQTVDMGRVFYGITPAITAVILSVAWRMSQQNVKSVAEGLIALVAIIFITNFKEVYVTLLLIFTSGCLGALLFRKTVELPDISGEKHRFPLLRVVLTSIMVVFLVTLSVTPISQIPFIEKDSISHMAYTFGGLSMIMFGGGYVFIPLLNEIVVNSNTWLTQQEFIDGLSMSQITPGPVTISAAFIAQKVVTDHSGLTMGVLSAFFSSVAIFGPPVILMVTASQALDWLKQSRITHAAMRGIKSTVLGMIFSAAIIFGFSALPAASEGVAFLDFIMTGEFWVKALPIAFMLIASLVALVRFQVGVVYVILVSGVMGWFMSGYLI